MRNKGALRFRRAPLAFSVLLSQSSPLPNWRECLDPL